MNNFQHGDLRPLCAGNGSRGSSAAGAVTTAPDGLAGPTLGVAGSTDLADTANLAVWNGTAVRLKCTEFEGLMKEASARVISTAMIEVGRRLAESLAAAEAIEGKGGLAGYRDTVSRLLSIILVEVLNPIYRKYPMVRPPELQEGPGDLSSRVLPKDAAPGGAKAKRSPARKSGRRRD